MPNPPERGPPCSKHNPERSCLCMCLRPALAGCNGQGCGWCLTGGASNAGSGGHYVRQAARAPRVHQAANPSAGACGRVLRMASNMIAREGDGECPAKHGACNEVLGWVVVLVMPYAPRIIIESQFIADKELAFWGHASAARGRRAYELYTNLASRHLCRHDACYSFSGASYGSHTCTHLAIPIVLLEGNNHRHESSSRGGVHIPYPSSTPVSR